MVNQYKDMIYLPIETSGEGEINAHSRVQMALGEAKVKAKKEFARGARRDRPAPWTRCRAYVEAHPGAASGPMYKVPARRRA